MKKILYIHGFNGNPKGGTFDGLVDYFSGTEFQVISFPFPDLHTDVEKTQRLIEKYVDENDVKIIVGASLGGFYTLCCERSVFKIAINPCMIPSKEIELLKDRTTGENISIDKNMIAKWKAMEEYNLKEEFRQAVAIFGKEDKTFHNGEECNYKNLFDKIFPSARMKSVMVDGFHSLTAKQISEGMEKVLKFFCEIHCIEGTVSEINELETMKKNRLTFFKINDKKIVVFQKSYEKYGELIKDGSKLKVYGKVESNCDGVDYDFISCERVKQDNVEEVRFQ